MTRISDFHEQILHGRLNGKSAKQIAADIEREFGFVTSAKNIHQYAWRESLPIATKQKQLDNPAIPFGQMKLKGGLTYEQARKLEAMALKWGCETIAEAALEILRDKLEEAE